MTTHDALWWLMAPNWWSVLVCSIVCGVHAVTDGECDAFHFDRQPSERQKGWPDIHTYFVTRRSCLWILVALFAGVPTAIGCMLMFPFFHEGAYYSRRNDLNGNVYARRWSEEPSSTSTSRWNFSYTERCWFAAIGIIILCVVLFGTANHVYWMR